MEHVDVVVVGAGISGIGAAYHLQTMSPDRTYTILEGRADIGGTWDLFRYPGVRSDSDMHTLGYSFKPWTHEKSIADGPSIMAYLRDTVREYGIDRHIRFGHLVRSASWDSSKARWTVQAEHDGRPVEMSCSFLFMCSGYYSYRKGHTPEFAGIDSYEGRVVHPQQWPDDLDVTGKRVLVIGSGATAMTVVPAVAATAAHVTMLQRSPTYVVSAPDRDAIANALRKVLPDKTAYAITRKKNIAMQQFFYRRTRTKPEKVKAKLLEMTSKQLGDDYVREHFTPSYNPWDERLCLIPNGDLYEAIKRGAASVVTDHIDTFTSTGVRLVSGAEIEADIVVTATGLEVVTLGEATFRVDGEVVDFAETWTYKGCMYSGVPNLASVFGYINASWTLRADLIAANVCRLLNHLRSTGTEVCVPRLRPSDASMTPRPWITGFEPGYLRRVMHRMPKQGDRSPWINPQHYGRDRQLFLHDPVDDGVMRFEPAGVPVASRSNAPAAAVVG
jgi:cation diffusion facilitator CzcD-associated flavoprotein CzcO